MQSQRIAPLRVRASLQSKLEPLGRYGERSMMAQQSDVDMTFPTAIDQILDM